MEENELNNAIEKTFKSAFGAELVAVYRKTKGLRMLIMKNYTK